MPASDHDHPVDPERVAAARRALSAESTGRRDLLAVLADPVRQRVVRALLAVEELCVGDLALALDVSEDSISYATRLLRDAGVLERRSAGRYGYYRLPDGPPRALLATVFSQLGDQEVGTTS